MPAQLRRIPRGKSFLVSQTVVRDSTSQLAVGVRSTAFGRPRQAQVTACGLRLHLRGDLTCSSVYHRATSSLTEVFIVRSVHHLTVFPLSVPQTCIVSLLPTIRSRAQPARHPNVDVAAAGSTTLASRPISTVLLPTLSVLTFPIYASSLRPAEHPMYACTWVDYDDTETEWIKERGQPATSPIVEELHLGHVESGELSPA